MTARQSVFSCLPLIDPPPRMPSADWAAEHMVNDQGRRYSQQSYPHFAAPNGPFDAVDDPRFTSIWLQYGSQVGKTFFGQTICAYFADQAPAPMMFCSADQKLAEEGIDRLYRSMAFIPCITERMPPEHRRPKRLVDFGRCRLYVAWARSVSTLADKAIKIGHGAELDKWQQPSTSKEAHPAKLFSDRGKSFHHTRKFIFEGTPTIKGESRIEAGYQLSDRRRYYVPCPSCEKYQILVFGDRKTEFGVKWDRDEHGKHHPSLANSSGYYQCAHCKGRIESYHRWEMFQRGVWCPEGCRVDEEHAREWFNGECESPLSRDPEAAQWGFKLVIGRPAMTGRDAGFHLSTLYSLSVHWGDIAEEFVKSNTDAQSLRNFVNQWLGLTWEKLAREQTWEQLGVRLIGMGKNACPNGIVPPWACLVTAGVDRQADYLVYSVKAWGPDRRNHTIAYGRLLGFDDLVKHVITYNWPAAGDAHVSYPTILTLIDAGFLPDQIHEFCDRMRATGLWVLPCRGTDRILHCPVYVDTIKKGPRAGRKVAFVESDSTQAWMDRQIYVLDQTRHDCMTIFSSPLELHRNYLNELLNQSNSAKDPGARRGRGDRWDKVDDQIGDDYRDAERYAFGSMYISTYGGPIREGQKFTRGPLQSGAGGPRIIGTFGGRR